MKNDYSRVTKRLPHPADRLIFEEGKYIYILSQSLQYGSMLLEEMDDGGIIIWNDDINDIPSIDLFTIFLQEFEVPLYVLYIDDKEEYDAVVKLHGKKVDLDMFNDIDIYDSEYGSYMIMPFKNEP